MELTKSQIDRLGERLRRDDASDEDIQRLDAFRRSFASVYEDVMRIVRVELSLEPTGRPAKSTTAIIDKLRRESIRLTQMQDVAGCRVVVTDVLVQERVVQKLREKFPQHEVMDRRHRPSHGYRAVHVVVTEERRPVEIQVRTLLQHLWAQFSEKLSDLFDPALKYGGGDESHRLLLVALSDAIAALEFRKLEINGDPTSPVPGNQVWVEKIREIAQTPRELEEVERNLMFTLAIKKMSVRKET